MAIFKRKSRNPQDTGMPRFRAGLIALIVIAIGTYFGFTKANPFSQPFELTAAFETASNVKPNSPVRIAGVEVGKVTKVEAVPDDSGAAIVTMEIKDKGLPIHEDAQLKIRPRIFLEGNFFVDLQPGSPTADVVEDGDDPIPTTQTSAPVQFADLLASLQSDTRADLQTFLQEYAKGLRGGGAEGFQRSIKYWEEAYRSGALANDASLGQEPTRDLQRLLKGQAGTARALVEDEEALKGLVTNLNITTGALASEDVALEQSIPLLRDTLEVAQPALASLNDALPSLRQFAVDALPGVRSSGPVLEASLPFIRELRGLMQPSELQGLAEELRVQTPRLVRLNLATIPLLEESRTLSACTNKVLVPFVNLEVPNPDEPGNNNQRVNNQIQRAFPGLAGESRLSDGGTQYFHAMAVPIGEFVRPGSPTDGGNQPPPRRPDQPCELQELPDLHAPAGTVLAYPVTEGSATAANQASFRPRNNDAAKVGQALLDAQKSFDKVFKAIEDKRTKAENAGREGSR
jgi:phospholipid/cholesterol/gamma-HCH transport system substrate-binding protein